MFDDACNGLHVGLNVFFSHEFMFSASFVDRLSTLSWGMYNWKYEFCG